MKIVSWNVNGIRAVERKNSLPPLFETNPDIICFQETKSTVEQAQQVLAAFPGYSFFGNEAEKKGYSGTAILTKLKPVKVWNHIGIPEHDTQGRVVTAEFDDFFLINTYVPNSGSELLRLGYRQTWDIALLQYIQKLELSKPVIIGGDFNVAHKPIDIARPKENYNKTAGYMQEEIDGMDKYLNAKLIDTFRHKYPEEIKYSWWSQRGGGRERGIGWRIDYFLVSHSIANRVKDAFIWNEYHGSDHCPVGIELL